MRRPHSPSHPLRGGCLTHAPRRPPRARLSYPKVMATTLTVSNGSEISAVAGTSSLRQFLNLILSTCIKRYNGLRKQLQRELRSSHSSRASCLLRYSLVRKVAHAEPVVAYTALVRDQMKQINPWHTAGQFRPAFGPSHKKVTQIAIVLLELRMDFAISMAKLCKDLPTA